VEAFWDPLFAVFPDLARNDYLLSSGTFEGSEWVATAGTFVGTFAADWLGIPTTGHATWIQYGALYRMVDGHIAETRLLFDVLDVLRQAGYRFVPALAPEVVAPGPSTQDGLLLEAHDEPASARTLEMVEEMISERLAAYDGEELDSVRLDEY
jgi:hypothetical protein